MVQKFRFRQTTVQIVYVRERYISNFRTMAQSSGNSCGTKLWNRALWNQHGRSLSGCMRRPTRSWTRRKDAVALREVRLRDFIVWFLCRLGLPSGVAMDIADRAVTAQATWSSADRRRDLWNWLLAESALMRKGFPREWITPLQSAAAPVLESVF